MSVLLKGILKKSSKLCQRRCIATTNYRKQADNDNLNRNVHSKMCGWQIHAYGDSAEELQYTDKIKMPAIKDPNHVLVKIEASSVNPIDVLMSKGYGSTLFKAIRCDSDNIEFPITLGREFCGIVKQRGMNVREGIDLEQHVWGVIPLHQTGCHSEYVVVNSNFVMKKPESLDVVEAAATLYAGLTAWSGLFVSGHLGGVCGALTSQGGGRGKKICILGASGSVGNIALQIARAENVQIVASCATDAVLNVKNAGADHVIDYTSDDAVNQFIANGPYDIILDCAGKGQKHAAEIPWRYEQYITFTSPMLRNFDEFGMGLGVFRNLIDVVESNVKSLTAQKGLVKWAYILPAPHGIEYLKNLVERGKLKPVIEEVYDFKLANKAFTHVGNGHLRGKIVLKH